MTSFAHLKCTSGKKIQLRKNLTFRMLPIYPWIWPNVCLLHFYGLHVVTQRILKFSGLFYPPSPNYLPSKGNGSYLFLYTNIQLNKLYIVGSQ
jgi:hypothetical protein